jgi:leucine-rich repeat protein SHOC2
VRFTSLKKALRQPELATELLLDASRTRLTSSDLSQIAELVNLRKLSLAGQRRLGWLTEELRQLKSLTELDLSGTAINDASVLEGMVHLTELRIELDRTPIKLFDALERLPLLTTLVMRDAPADIGRLRQVVDLKLTAGQPSLAPLAMMMSLRTLTLDVGGTLSKEIGRLRQIVKLAIGRRCSALPEELGDCEALEVIEASQSRVGHLPRSIGRLGRLRELHLHGTQLAALPDTVCDLAELRVLDLRGTLLARLPKDIGRLGKLEELDLLGTKIAALPASAGRLASLRRFDAKHTQLRELPPGFAELRFDQCELPDELTGAIVIEPREDVESIFLEGPERTLPPSLGDPLSVYVTMPELEGAPFVFGTLRRVERMVLASPKIDLARVLELLAESKELSYLQLEKYPSLPATIGGLVSLKTLDAARCPLSGLPVELARLERLDQLICGVIDAPIFAMPWLRRLSVRNARVKTLPPEIGKLAALQELDLWNNSLVELPAELAALASLTEITFATDALADPKGVKDRLPAGRWLKKQLHGKNASWTKQPS